MATQECNINWSITYHKLHINVRRQEGINIVYPCNKYTEVMHVNFLFLPNRPFNFEKFVFL